MEARMKSAGNPDVITAIQQLNKAIHAGGVDPLVLESTCGPARSTAAATSSTGSTARSGSRPARPGELGGASSTRRPCLPAIKG